MSNFLNDDIIYLWKKHGKELSALKLIITYDTFVQEYVPRYVYSSNLLDKEIRYINNLARITNVIDIMDI